MGVKDRSVIESTLGIEKKIVEWNEGVEQDDGYEIRGAGLMLAKQI